jgi:hypothetical protein
MRLAKTEPLRVPFLLSRIDPDAGGISNLPEDANKLLFQAPVLLSRIDPDAGGIYSREINPEFREGFLFRGSSEGP